jgi:hypothetical protein
MTAAVAQESGTPSANLKGLDAISIQIELLPDEASRGKIDIEQITSTLRRDIEGRLKAHQIRSEPKGPRTAVLRLTARLLAVPNEPITAITGDLEIMDRVVLVRDPNGTTTALIWAALNQAVAGPKRIPDIIRLMVTDLVDNFISAHSSANGR